MEVINSDILTVTSGVIAHGVNCQGAMGSGVAKVIYTKYPKVRKDFIEKGKGTLGDIQFVHVTDDLLVVNCYTQEFYGYDGKRYADLKAIRKCLNLLASSTTTVHLPAVGCGLAGLDLEELKDILLEIEGHHNRDIFVLHLLGE